MKRFIFIIGGARSGKSSYSVELAKGLGKRVVFIATAAAGDKEMLKRIRLHKASRPRSWGVIDETKDISSVLPQLTGKYSIALIDCLGLLVSNLLSEGLNDKQIEKKIEVLIATILKLNLITILVSNEVGEGIVPANALSRRFRDLLGTFNQMIAKKANDVILMKAGIPIKIKSSKFKTKNF